MPPTPWQRRFRKLAVFAGTLSSLYLLANYTFDRLREARVRAIKDREVKDRLKSHFTSLLSTISFTLYALLPTVQPQLFERYPVENTSQALQGMSMTSSTASLQPEQVVSAETPDNSLHLNRGDEVGETISNKGEAPSTVGESWASEFRQREGEHRAPSSERDDVLSSATSQSISLPPTDLSSDTNSPPSNLSSSVMLSPSPPRRSPPVATKSKKELWRDLKIQSIAKSLTTAYTVPLLLILTSAQLSTLARIKYLKDVQQSNATSSDNQPDGTRRRDRPSRDSDQDGNDDEDEDTPVLQVKRTRGGWLNYFSVEAMGLSDFVEQQSNTPFAAIGNYLPGFLKPAQAHVAQSEERRGNEEDEAEKSNAERLFLTYSWWLLHVGWQEVADRVEEAVERVFADMPLKRELSPEDWQRVIKESRAIVETEDNGTKLYDFAQHVIPATPLSTVPLDCPLPTHPETSTRLTELLAETRQQLASPDARYLLDKGVSELLRNLTDHLRSELYTTQDLQTLPSRRLVDCLPELNRWAKGVWGGVPDSGVEGVLSLPDFENFAALIFGDWA